MKTFFTEESKKSFNKIIFSLHPSSYKIRFAQSCIIDFSEFSYDNNIAMTKNINFLPIYERDSRPVPASFSIDIKLYETNEEYVSDYVSSAEIYSSSNVKSISDYITETEKLIYNRSKIMVTNDFLNLLGINTILISDSSCVIEDNYLSLSLSCIEFIPYVPIK